MPEDQFADDPLPVDPMDPRAWNGGLRQLWTSMWHVKRMSVDDEAMFRHRFKVDGFPFARLASWVGAIAGTCLILVDKRLDPTSLSYARLSGVLLVLFLAPLAFTFWKRWSLINYQWLLTITYILHLSGLATSIEKQDIQLLDAPIILTYVFILLFLRLPFRFAFLLTFPSFFVLMILALIDMASFAVNPLILIGITVLLGLYVNWRTEYDARILFLRGESLRAAQQAAGARIGELLDDIGAIRESRNTTLERVGHNLRNELAAILTRVETLRILTTVPTPEVAACLDSMVQVSSELVQKFNHIMRLRKLEQGKSLPDVEPVVLNDLVEKIATAYRERAQKQKLNFVLRLPNTRVCLGKTNYAVLCECVENLVANAIKYTPAREMPRSGVILGLSFQPPEQFRIDVYDTGIGIPEKDQARVWQQFEQAANGESYRAGGMGLGLGLVAHMVRQLDSAAPGHRLDYRSVEGRGSRFSIEVPFSSEEVKDAAAVVLIAKLPESSFDEQSRLLKNSFVFVLEDNLNHKKSIEGLLLAWGVDFESGEKSQDLLIHPPERFPEVIVTDFALAGGETAIEAIKAIRSAYYGKAIPAIIITGQVVSDELLQQITPVSRFEKPYDAALLRSAIVGFLEIEAT